MNVRLLEPWLLLLALAVIPVMLWTIRNAAPREGRVRFSTLGVLARLPVTARVRWRPIVDVFRLLALLLVVLALARPAVTRTAEASPRAGVDLALAMDISYSMSERDLGSKTRLDTSKDVIQDFVSGRQGDRIGLVVFAGEGVGVSPLTTDYPVLLGLLGGVDFGKLPEGTAIGNGLATAVNLVREGQGKSKVVVLLTDGQNNSGDVSPTAATQLAQRLNVKVYTVGVGASRATDRTRRSFGGGVDEEGLKAIADATGGAYFRATDENTLKDIYDTIDRLEKTEQGTQREVRVIDLSGYVLFGALLLLIAELAFRNTLFRRAS